MFITLSVAFGVYVHADDDEHINAYVKPLTFSRYSHPAGQEKLTGEAIRGRTGLSDSRLHISAYQIKLAAHEQGRTTTR
jgi:hypothetical protein